MRKQSHLEKILSILSNHGSVGNMPGFYQIFFILLMVCWFCTMTCMKNM